MARRDFGEKDESKDFHGKRDQTLAFRHQSTHYGNCLASVVHVRAPSFPVAQVKRSRRLSMASAADRLFELENRSNGNVFDKMVHGCTLSAVLESSPELLRR